MLAVADAAAYLQRNARKIEALLASGISADQARWKPDPNSWSLVEVVSHLRDTERADFRVRLEHILHKPGEAWPPIDPMGWVTERDYNANKLDPTLESFLQARQDSIAWLTSLERPNLETLAVSASGSMRAGDMLAAWIAHDLLHMRQIIELLWAYGLRELAPFDPAYAGEW